MGSNDIEWGKLSRVEFKQALTKRLADPESVTEICAEIVEYLFSAADVYRLLKDLECTCIWDLRRRMYTFKKAETADEIGLFDSLRGRRIEEKKSAVETIRVLRVLEYVGPRAEVEELVARSVQGQKTFGKPGREITIRAATIGTYPEILNEHRQSEPDAQTNPLPDGCHCPPGQCMAPVVMGRQMPCRDPQKAARTDVPTVPLSDYKINWPDCAPLTEQQLLNMIKGADGSITIHTHRLETLFPKETFRQSLDEFCVTHGLSWDYISSIHRGDYYQFYIAKTTGR